MVNLQCFIFPLPVLWPWPFSTSRMSCCFSCTGLLILLRLTGFSGVSSSSALLSSRPDEGCGEGTGTLLWGSSTPSSIISRGEETEVKVQSLEACLRYHGEDWCGLFGIRPTSPMATPGGRPGRHSQQKEAEDYLSRIKLREIFQVLYISNQSI